MVAMLGGYALAYIAMLCGTFAWGMDSSSLVSHQQPKILGAHLEFLASALDGKISLGWLRTNVVARGQRGCVKEVEPGT
nr:mediator of rna polymerase ii transcription subunit 33b [Quercus suber]